MKCEMDNSIHEPHPTGQSVQKDCCRRATKQRLFPANFYTLVGISCPMKTHDAFPCLHLKDQYIYKKERLTVVGP